MSNALDIFENVGTKEDKRAAISKLEEKLSLMPQSFTETIHHFAKGLYCRELFIPKGTLLVGKIHKEETLNILAYGDISILTEDGFKRVEAPYVVIGKSGQKKVGFAHSDVCWINVHATKEKDLEKIEEEFIAKDFDEVSSLSEDEKKQVEDMKKELLCHG